MATYVIVGGGAGGASAAARLRRRDEAAEIIMLERGKYVSFANCGLPYYVGEEITEREALLVSTPEKLAGEFAIDVRTEQEVTAVDRVAHEVEVRSLASGETYRLRYDKLILSPGAARWCRPFRGRTCPVCSPCATSKTWIVSRARGCRRSARGGGGGRRFYSAWRWPRTWPPVA
jgi:NADPH-dependent 2,4-dienoyl-CoA reductase/sulfur reductase-like enzyme